MSMNFSIWHEMSQFNLYHCILHIMSLDTSQVKFHAWNKKTKLSGSLGNEGHSL